ncbi:hypothetical protein RiCNE_11930 [Rickettsia endosymbiont of Culicoides newsteadi]|nr:hypothetical protein RiCNE_11930 [Rickettsia endosymbiont of Culicoides newsteadi]
MLHLQGQLYSLVILILSKFEKCNKILMGLKNKLNSLSDKRKPYRTI